jgi:prevent-host-death family protein
MVNGVSIAEVKSRFSEFVSRAAGGERIVIHRRTRAVAVLLSAGEVERLERAARAGEQLALALGQDPEVLKQIQNGEAHPAMAAFGLWRDEDEFASLAEDVIQNRQTQPARGQLVE